MPGSCWHHDDFLFETQFPMTEQPTETPVRAGDELLERFLRRRRMQTPFTRWLQPQIQPQQGAVGISVSREIVRAFQSVWKYLSAKHPPRPSGQ